MASIVDELNIDLQENIRRLLIANPALRNSDRKLFARLATNILGGQSVTEKMSAYEFLCHYTEHESKLPSEESIGRIRRDLQLHNPELQGTMYKQRHDKQKVVREKLGYVQSNMLLEDLKVQRLNPEED